MELTRDQWTRRRNPRNLSAVFHAGEQMRCPHARKRASGQWQICGGALGRTPRWAREAVVRGIPGLPVIGNSDHECRTCESCRKPVDVYLVRQQELRATG